MSAPTRPEPLIRVAGLTHKHGARVAVDALDLSVSPGETVGLLGPNGCGKSTLLSLMAGLTSVQQGRIDVTLDGTTLHPGARALRAATGVVFQSPSLDGTLTARENLVLAGTMHGLRGREARRRADTLLAWADLTDRAGDLVKTLSGGMRRRLELARAMCPEPQILLLDEPTTGLDAGAFSRVWARLDTLRATRQLTIVVATHTPAEAARCDRLVLMRDGRVIETGTPAELTRQMAPDLVTLETGDPDGVVATLQDRLGVTGRADAAAGCVFIEHDAGHQLIAKLVAELPGHLIDAVSLRRPTLGDVFLKLSGASLSADSASLAAAA